MHYKPWLQIVEAEVFRNMNNLRLLILQRVAYFAKNIFEYLPNKLKWIEWSKFYVNWSSPVSFFVKGRLVGLVMNGVVNKHPRIIFEVNYTSDLLLLVCA